MNSRITKMGFISGTLILGIPSLSCAPYCYREYCLCIEETPNIHVIEKFDGIASNGDKVHMAKIGVPTKSMILGNGYRIIFWSPVTILSNHVNITAQSSSDKPIDIVGTGVHKGGINPNKTNESIFDFIGINSMGISSFSFSVVDSKGKTLGNETVKYKIRMVGFTVGFDSI